VPTKNRSWVKLLAYCFISALVISLAFATLFAGASLAFGLDQSSESSGTRGSAPAPAKTFSGVITDSFCGARHAMNTRKDPAECTRACVRRGAHYVLVNGDTTYVLVGKRAVLDKFAGQRVQVKGTLAGDTLKASLVAAESAVRRHPARPRSPTPLDARR
jgi:hypothetical protein